DMNGADTFCPFNLSTAHARHTRAGRERDCATGRALGIQIHQQGCPAVVRCGNCNVGGHNAVHHEVRRGYGDYTNHGTGGREMQVHRPVGGRSGLQQCQVAVRVTTPPVPLGNLVARSCEGEYPGTREPLHFGNTAHMRTSHFACEGSQVRQGKAYHDSRKQHRERWCGRHLCPPCCREAPHVFAVHDHCNFQRVKRHACLLAGQCHTCNRGSRVHRLNAKQWVNCP